MLINASQDSIINTAKSVGLDPNAVAVNTAIAEQTFFANMQAQGTLAQNYLPLAKAYLTAIVIGLSWLIAIFSIIFGSYAHIRTFLMLCCWLVTWSVMLCFLNFLNDLNLMKAAEVITGRKEALTIGTNTLIFKKIASNSNFLNYLVMATPLLAFAIVKASEQGLVSFASGLSQAVSGGARAAGGFATQQGLSTSTAIAAPKADEVIATSGGITTHTSASNIDGFVTSFASKTTGGAYSNTDINNANMNGTNINGMIAGTILSAGTLSTINSTAEASGQTWNQQFNDTYNHLSQSAKSSALSEARNIMEGNNESFKTSFANNFAQEIAKASGLTTSEQARISAYAEASGGFRVAGNGASFGTKGEVSGSIESSLTLSAKEKAAYQEAMERASVKTLAESHSVNSDWTRSLSNSDSTAYSKMVGYADTYNQTQSAVQAVNSNNIDNVMNAYARDLAAVDGKNFDNLSTTEQNTYFAKAGNQISDMIKNDPSTIANYASQYGAGSNVGANTIAGPSAAGMGFAKVGGNTLLNHNQNQDYLNARRENMRNSSDIDQQDVKGAVQNSNLNKEVGKKLEAADKVLHAGLGGKKGI